jgi:alpha-1,2-mannosyltransferase
MSLKIERIAVALAVCGAAAMALLVGLRGLGAGPWLATVLALAVAGAGAIVLARRLPADLDGLARTHRWWCAAWLLVALVALGQTARMSAFMLDAQDKQHSLLPDDSWYVAHSCLTAYSEGARFALEDEANIYRPELYLDRNLGAFKVDPYHYPPPFLLLPLAAKALSGDDYPRLRMCWYALSAMALLLALATVAGNLAGEARRRAIAAAPAIWLSFPVQLGFQMSNVQLLVLSIAMLAWAAFRRLRPLGGFLLAVAIVAKIFPGILALDLLLRRRWRDAASTAAFGLVLCGAIYAVVGSEPFRAFVDYELPRLSSGEAFERPLSRPFAVAHNMSPFGIAVKLARLGVPGMSLAGGRVIATIYGLGLLALALWVARRGVAHALTGAGTGSEISVWLALLSLGTLASPFAPASYVLASVVWLVAIDREDFSISFAAIVWIATSAPFLLPREGDFLLRTLAFAPAQLIALSVPMYALWRAGRRAFPPAIEPLPEMAGN